MLTTCSRSHISEGQRATKLCPGLKPGPQAYGSISLGWNKSLQNLQLPQLITLQPFDLQKPTLSLWKDLKHIVNIILTQETGSILDEIAKSNSFLRYLDIGSILIHRRSLFVRSEY